MMKQAAEKLILKYIFVFTLVLTCLFTGRVQASSEIDVGLIVSQFSAEVIAPSAFFRRSNRTVCLRSDRAGWKSDDTGEGQVLYCGQFRQNYAGQSPTG